MFEKIKKFLYGNTEKCDDIESGTNLKIGSKDIINSVDQLKNNKNTNGNNINTNVPGLTNYKLPSITLLDNPKHINRNDEIENNKKIIEDTLKSFKVKATISEIHIGPCYTEYVLSLSNGTKISSISSLRKEFQLYLSSEDVFIEAPIPNTTNVGINVKNKEKSTINLKELIKEIKNNTDDIILPIGQDRFGNNEYLNLSQQRNILISGIPGSGKTNLINCLISSILMKYYPKDIKLMLIDTKRIELSNYNGAPHLMSPVVTDPRKASVALQKMVSEMEKRYSMFEDNKVKNINEYNQLTNDSLSNSIEKIPKIIIIIDELFDLILNDSINVQDSISRITQNGFSVGIYLIVATQRPSSEIITNVIKSNIHCRMAFMVRTQQDSRIILDDTGAEKITEIGDMLYQKKGSIRSKYIHNCLISENEIKRLIDHVSKEQVANYDNTFGEMKIDGYNTVSDEYEDPLYDQIIEFAISTGKISASLIQRRFRLGYNRAVRVIDLLEERGIIGPANGSKPREVLVKFEESDK